jgi:hypothetical protein
MVVSRPLALMMVIDPLLQSANKAWKGVLHMDSSSEAMKERSIN